MEFLNSSVSKSRSTGRLMKKGRLFGGKPSPSRYLCVSSGVRSSFTRLSNFVLIKTVLLKFGSILRTIGREVELAHSTVDCSIQMIILLFCFITLSEREKQNYHLY